MSSGSIFDPGSDQCQVCWHDIGSDDERCPDCGALKCEVCGECSDTVVAGECGQCDRESYYHAQMKTERE